MPNEVTNISRQEVPQTIRSGHQDLTFNSMGENFEVSNKFLINHPTVLVILLR